MSESKEEIVRRMAANFTPEAAQAAREQIARGEFEVLTENPGVHFPVVGFGAQRFVHYYKRVYGEWVAEFQDATTGQYHYLTYNEEPTFLKGGQRYRLEVTVITLDEKPAGE